MDIDEADDFTPVPGASRRDDSTTSSSYVDGVPSKHRSALQKTVKTASAVIEKTALTAGVVIDKSTPYVKQKGTELKRTARKTARVVAAVSSAAVKNVGEKVVEMVEPTPDIEYDTGRGDSPRSSHDSADGEIIHNGNGAYYRNWSIKDRRSSRNKSNNTASNMEPGDELAWKIIKVVLKGWFIIWILFAILVISAELFTPNHKKVQKNKAILTADEEAKFLQISENIVSSCAYSKLDTEEGREGCQALCKDHMCCFIDDDNQNNVLESHKYGCQSNPDKLCGAYGGCEALIVSEEDATIYDADGNDVFAEEDDANNDQDTNAVATVATVTDSTSLSGLQLIEHVISSVCVSNNLHKRHGLLECASLCNPSMCCFDPKEINLLNPKMDLILKMEGISNDLLNRTALGTCMNEEADGDETKPNHYCKVHAGCKNILLVGTTSRTKKEHIVHDPLVGFHDANNESSTSNVTTEEKRTIEGVAIFFGLIIAFSAYLLIYKRSETLVPFESPAAIGRALRDRIDNVRSYRRAKNEEMVDFVENRDDQVPEQPSMEFV